MQLTSPNDRLMEKMYSSIFFVVFFLLIWLIKRTLLADILHEHEGIEGIWITARGNLATDGHDV